MAASLKRTSKGRQKVPMKKMTNESNLQVTFSKRRSGLFKKASELCTLCGVQVCLIVFSPGEKAYSFGNPNVETLLQRFLDGSPAAAIPMDAAQSIADAQRAARVRGLNAQLTELNDELQALRKRATELNRNTRDNQVPQQWWDGPFDQMTLPQMKHLKAALELMQKTVNRLISEKIPLQSPIHDANANANANTPPPPVAPATTTPAPFYANGSSSSASASFVAATGGGSNYYVPQRMWFHQQNTTTVLQNERRYHDLNINVVNQVYYGGYTSMLLGGGFGPYGGPDGFY